MAPRTPKSPADKPAKPAKPAKAEKAAKPAAPPRAGEGRPAAAKAAKAKDNAPAKAGADATVTVKLKDLVDQVATASGLKKPEAKKAVEATLSVIGGALARNASLAVPPLGKLRVAKSAGGTLTLKLRLADAPRAAGLALADDGEDG